MKKFLPFILILIVLVELFVPIKNSQAQSVLYCKNTATGQIVIQPPGVSSCDPGWTQVNPDGTPLETPPGGTTGDPQSGTPPSDPNGAPGGSGTTPNSGASTTVASTPADPQSDLFGSCFGNSSGWSWDVSGCITRIFYWVFLVLPSAILYLTAYLFNAMLALTLGTILYNNNFLPEAWRIVRDFSNIFFILVLLYISIKLILGLGGAEIKKMVVSVIVAALLINFSMFMTKVVIDSSNILALIFYNKIQVVSTGPAAIAVKSTVTKATEVQTGDTADTYTKTLNPDVVGVEEKDIAGAIVSGFNPAKFINAKDINDKAQKGPSLFEKLKDINKTGGTVNPFRPIDSTITNFRIASAITGSALSSGGDEKTLPTSVALTVIFVACLVYLFAAYAFFVAGLAFIGRLIELWILIIFSPFAFMSLSVPKLKSVDYLGWDAWLKRLITVAFMAPIFMFFLLLISKVVQIDVFKDIQNTENGIELSVPHLLVILAIPAVIYITMLYKATSFAKKGAGDFGEAAFKYGQMAAVAVGGLALAAASGGATVAIGGIGGTALNTLGKKAGNNFVGNKLRDAGGFLQNRSFDVRNIKTLGISDKFTKAGFGKGRDKSWSVTKEKQKEKHEKRAAELEKRWTAGDKKEIEIAKTNLSEKTAELKTGPESVAVEHAKERLKAAELPVKAELEHLDVLISKFEKDLNNAVKAGDVAAQTTATTNLNREKTNKEAIRRGQGLQTLEDNVRTAQTAYNTREAAELLPLEKALVDAQRSYDVKSGEVIRKFASQIEGRGSTAWGITRNLGLYSTAQADATARTIRQRAKPEGASEKK